jgi:Mn2+/Fe2+ NRAMP family transporter
MKKVLSIVLWSVIAGAFIGPGTVTTAASAGTGFGFTLLWALVFSTLACLLLQEASARVTILSGSELGELLRIRSHPGWLRTSILVLVLGAIVLGCAAYQAGNILGAVVGAERLTGLPSQALTLIIGAGAGVLLWMGTSRIIGIVFGALVAVMGFAFLVTAVQLEPSISDLLRSSLIPTTPSGSGLLIIALIGTTVVPYNLFLGSGLARGQNLGEARLGLVVAILLGGLISGAILVVGTAVTGEFSYSALASVLANRLGGWAEILFGIGLFAAGFSSAVSAPWAAAMTTRSLFGAGEHDRWKDTDWRYRSVWAAVLLTGVAFGVVGASPIPAIVAAQAFNGLLLPVVAVFLLILANDRKTLGRAGIGGWPNTLLLLATVWVTILLGLSNLARAGSRVFGYAPPSERLLLIAACVTATIVFVPIVRAVTRARAA